MIAGTPALGSVMMATQYDPSAPTFQTKRQLDSYDFATTTVPYEAALHPVECAPGSTSMENYYVRTVNKKRADLSPPALFTQMDAPNKFYTGDIRFSDLGRFSIATQGSSSEYVCGELWVTYDVTLSKPIIDGWADSKELVILADFRPSTPGISGSVPPWFYQPTIWNNNFSPEIRQGPETVYYAVPTQDFSINTVTNRLIVYTAGSWRLEVFLSRPTGGISGSGIVSVVDPNRLVLQQKVSYGTSHWLHVIAEFTVLKTYGYPDESNALEFITSGIDMSQVEGSFTRVKLTPLSCI